MNSNQIEVNKSADLKILLTIVARGSAIVTELNTLVDLVPTPFKHKNSTNSNNHYLDNERRHTLDDLIYDFKYFNDIDKYEANIENNDVLKKADEEFCDNFIDILIRFYLTFESIQRFASDLNNFVQELEADTLVGLTLVDVLQDNDGRQLLCEAYFLLGYMLLTADNNFEGSLREKLIVSYYRYYAHRSSPESNLDDTCNLLRSTGFKSVTQMNSINNNDLAIEHRPQGYPENFFNRAKVNVSVVNLLVAKLLSVDIYNQTISTFPHPDHRSFALSQQASMLYVILYFCPNILISQKSKMREITDKFYYDNWIINIHMGELVSLVEAWEPYKAARESLYQLHDIEGVTNLSKHFNRQFEKVSKQSIEFSSDGWLNETTVLEHHTKILNHIRDGNVVLKWMLIHSKIFPKWRLKLSKSLNAIVIKYLPNQEILYKFLQKLAELEKKFSKIYNGMTSCKVRSMLENKIRAKETLDELINIFTDDKPMRWIQPGVNSKLVDLLKKIQSSLGELNFDQHVDRDTLIKLINELDMVQESYSDGKNLQVAQLFSDTKATLVCILRYTNLSADVGSVLHSITDFSYCWRIVDETFTSLMRKIIKDNPLKLNGLESTFMKLASGIEVNLIRIQQVNSQDDLLCVSQYYSCKLVSYIRRVLQVIPETILELLSDIINIQTEYVSRDMPSKISLDCLKDYTLPEKRYRMLELTFKVSHFAECMTMMHDSTIGLVTINSKQLLEDGIRQELIKKMSNSIQKTLNFDDNQSIIDYQQYSLYVESKLDKLNIIMNGYKNSFEYIQDYLFIYGLRMWQEELNRIVKFDTEQASEVLLDTNFNQRNCELSCNELQSLFFNIHSDDDEKVYNSNYLKSSFMVRLLNEVLKITNPRLTIHSEQMSAWYEQKAEHKKVLDSKIFELIASSLGVTGLNGLDRLCSTVIAIELQKLDTLLVGVGTDNHNSQVIIESIKSIKNLRNHTNVTKQVASKIYSMATGKISFYSDRIINHLLSIGQLQAIRMCISSVLSTRCRYEARNLYGCLDTLNTTLLSTLRHGKKITQHKKDLSQHSNFKQSSSNQEVPLDENDDVDCNIEDSQLIFDLANHVEWVGLSDPLNKIYTLALQSSHNSEIYQFRENMVSIDMMFLILLDQCSKFHFSRSINNFVPKQSRSFYEKPNTVDAQPLFYGLITYINHCQPYLSVNNEIETEASEYGEYGSQSALTKLLEQMSIYVKQMFDHSSSIVRMGSSNSQDIRLETVNMVLSITELVRLSNISSEELLKETFLPCFLFETFQSTMYRLNDINNDINH